MSANFKLRSGLESRFLSSAAVEVLDLWAMAHDCRQEIEKRVRSGYSYGKFLHIAVVHPTSLSDFNLNQIYQLINHSRIRSFREVLIKDFMDKRTMVNIFGVRFPTQNIQPLDYRI